jgi:hypothetical protein
MAEKNWLEPYQAYFKENPKKFPGDPQVPPYTPPFEDSEFFNEKLGPDESIYLHNNLGQALLDLQNLSPNVIPARVIGAIQVNNFVEDDEQQLFNCIIDYNTFDLYSRDSIEKLLEAVNLLRDIVIHEPENFSIVNLSSQELIKSTLLRCISVLQIWLASEENRKSSLVNIREELMKEMKGLDKDRDLIAKFYRESLLDFVSVVRKIVAMINQVPANFEGVRGDLIEIRRKIKGVFIINEHEVKIDQLALSDVEVMIKGLYLV